MDARFILISVCLTLCLARSGLSAGGPVIELKEEACVRSNVLLLKDVAILQGFDAAWMNRLAEIPLAPAPEFGAVTLLSRRQIGEIIQNATGPLHEITFTGASTVQVRLQGRHLEPDEIVPIVKAYLAETSPWKAGEIAVFPVGNLKGAEVPPGKLELKVTFRAFFAGRHRMLIPIDVVQMGKTLRSFWITVDVRVRAEVLTAARKIPPGTEVAAEDVAKALIEIPDLSADYARSPEDVLGKVARRSFSPGDPLTREAFANPLLVTNGETVRLRLERSGIVLTSLARAEQDGRLGQVIRVRSLDFSTRLKALVTGRAEVKIQ